MRNLPQEGHAERAGIFSFFTPPRLDDLALVDFFLGTGAIPIF